jgi:hypothetical protein
MGYEWTHPSRGRIEIDLGMIRVRRRPRIRDEMRSSADEENNDGCLRIG